MQWMLRSHCDPKINLSRKGNIQKNSKMNLWGERAPDFLNSQGLFPAETQIQVLWPPRFLVCALTLSHFVVFSAAAAVLLLGSVTWPLPALLLPLLVKPFLPWSLKCSPKWWITPALVSPFSLMRHLLQILQCSIDWGKELQPTCRQPCHHSPQE